MVEKLLFMGPSDDRSIWSSCWTMKQNDTIEYTNWAVQLDTIEVDYNLYIITMTKSTMLCKAANLLFGANTSSSFI